MRRRTAKRNAEQDAEARKCRAKLERVHASHGMVEPIPPAMEKNCGKGTMLIARPLDVDALVRRIRKGRIATMGQIRARLAADAGADIACPLTTGIFLRIVAETAEEDRSVGVSRITPYWRTIRDDGSLNEKFPGGPNAQATKLRAEGHSIGRIGRGRALKVLGFAEKLARL